jgi:probable rRNA maturation factor
MDEPDRSSRPPTEADDQPPPTTAPSIIVEVLDALALLDQSTSCKLTDLASRALSYLPNNGQVRVKIVDDQRMSDAHEQFSGITGTTDVLTFDLAQPTDSFDEKTLDTDLTICFDEASRQATRHGHPVERELLLYIIHGTLHCLGYNDQDETQFQRMHKKEDEILRTIGVGDTFFTPQIPTDKEQQS